MPCTETNDCHSETRREWCVPNVSQTFVFRSKSCFLTMSNEVFIYKWWQVKHSCYYGLCKCQTFNLKFDGKCVWGNTIYIYILFKFYICAVKQLWSYVFLNSNCEQKSMHTLFTSRHPRHRESTDEFPGGAQLDMSLTFDVEAFYLPLFDRQWSRSYSIGMSGYLQCITSTY